MYEPHVSGEKYQITIPRRLFLRRGRACHREGSQDEHIPLQTLSTWMGVTSQYLFYLATTDLYKI